MHARFASLMLLAWLVAAACGCARKSGDDAAGGEGVAGEESKAGSLLAYEHDVRLEVAAETIQSRIDDVRSACREERHGACSILSIEVASGDDASGAIVVRTLPTAVEPLVRLAARNDVPATRQLRAEDLADATAEAGDRREFLERQRAELVAWSAREGLAAADMIALSQQVASVDQELQSLAQEQAKRQRRIETNKLAIRFDSPSAQEGIVGVWQTFAESLVEGIDAAAEYLGYFLPLLLLAFPIALAWRAAWRRMTR